MHVGIHIYIYRERFISYCIHMLCLQAGPKRFSAPGSDIRGVDACGLIPSSKGRRVQVPKNEAFTENPYHGFRKQKP